MSSRLGIYSSLKMNWALRKEVLSVDLDAQSYHFRRSMIEAELALSIKFNEEDMVSKVEIDTILSRI